jgi:hypothetical protein
VDEPGLCCGKEMKKIRKADKNPTNQNYECKSCGKKSEEQKDCCGKPMTKIEYKQFKCEKCSHLAKEEKECCGQLMKPAGQK